jgi:hypothetical protein
LEANVFLFGSLHVLALYAWKRIAGVIEFDEGVYEEIQRRAALVPPAQRQAAIDAMVKNRAVIGREVMLRKKEEEDAIRSRNFAIGCIFWSVVLTIFALYMLGGK